MMAISQASAFLTMQKFGNYFRFALMLIALIGVISTFAPASVSGTGAGATGATTVVPSTLTENIISPICKVYNAVEAAVFVLGLALLIVGALMYAGGNIAPGNLKGQIQGYGLGMITGGIAGVAIAMIAPWILGVISNNTTIAATCKGYS